MAKRGSEDLKKLAALQSSLVSHYFISCDPRPQSGCIRSYARLILYTYIYIYIPLAESEDGITEDVA